MSSGTGRDYEMLVGHAFVELWDRMQAGDQKISQYKARDVTDDIKRLLGFRSLHIQASSDKQRLILTVDGHPFRLEEVGSGIAHLVVTLISVAVRAQDFIFIDEPEMGLHLSLQVEFLMALARHAGRGVVFATHNLGLARAVAQKIYSIQRLPEGNSVVRLLESGGPPTENLGEIQYQLYRAMGYKTVLLVEGSTDITVYKEFLRLLDLDRRVVLLSLGGASLIRAGVEPALREVQSACEHVVALVDSEKRSDDAKPDPARAGFLTACKNVGITCHLTERRATENYLTDAAIKRALGSHRRQLDPYESLKTVPSAWPKSNSWKAAAEMTSADLKDTDIGKFLLDHCQ
jgi:hypothetical protein